MRDSRVWRLVQLSADNYKMLGARLNGKDGNLQSPQQESALAGYEAYLARGRYDGGAACADNQADDRGVH